MIFKCQNSAFDHLKDSPSLRSFADLVLSLVQSFGVVCASIKTSSGGLHIVKLKDMVIIYIISLCGAKSELLTELLTQLPVERRMINILLQTCKIKRKYSFYRLNPSNARVWSSGEVCRYCVE